MNKIERMVPAGIVLDMQLWGYFLGGRGRSWCVGPGGTRWDPVGPGGWVGPRRRWA